LAAENDRDRAALQLSTRLKQIVESNGQINDAACRKYLKQLQQEQYDAE
jgi:hypothetical protein